MKFVAVVLAVVVTVALVAVGERVKSKLSKEFKIENKH